MGESIEYGDVIQEVRGAMNPGRLKLSSSNIMFKNIKTGKVEQFQASDIEKAHWLLRARGYCLKLILQSGPVHRFDGMKESEFDRLSGFISKNYDTKLEKIDLSYKGWNYGTAKFKGNSLSFEIDHKQAFEVPLGNVSHTTTLKNEVTIEFHQNDDAAVSLMEMRFHIPSDSTNSEKDPVQDFYKNVLNSADIIQVQGDAIATFQEIQCLTPRGRYDIKIYPTFLQLHGKTFDYKIPYTTILRLFLLPHRDGRQMFFVISLDPPIKQGQTRYPFLIVLFNKEEESTIELELSEEDIQEKYEGKLAKEMSGPEYEIISRVFKALVNRKITVPGSFLGASGSHSIACSYKAATGFLYPLERGLIFVHKPPVHIRFDEVSSVNFARSTGANTRSFDFDIETKAGSVYTFVGIEKDEYGKLYDFISGKKLRVRNIGEGKSDKVTYKDDWDSDEEDNHDAYLHRMKAEGKQRVEAGEDDLMDSDDSSDESFAPADSGSEVPEEWDSNPETTSSEDSDEDYTASGSEDEDAREERRKKKEKEKEKKQKEKEKKKKKSKADGEKSESKPRKRRQKKERDPDKPKRAATGYMLWLNEVREDIKKENPGISITELTKAAGEKWRNMTDKTKWEEQAKEAREVYMAAMAEYKKKVKDEPGSPSQSPAKSKKKKSSPRKSVGESKAGSGDAYKSKEFISSSGSGESSSDEDKPLKKKLKGKDEEDEEMDSAPPSSEGEASGSGSGGASDDE